MKNKKVEFKKMLTAWVCAEDIAIMKSSGYNVSEFVRQAIREKVDELTKKKRATQDPLSR